MTRMLLTLALATPLFSATVQPDGFATTTTSTTEIVRYADIGLDVGPTIHVAQPVVVVVNAGGGNSDWKDPEDWQHIGNGWDSGNNPHHGGPVPEPETYGATLVGAALGFFMWRKRRKAKAKA